MFWRGKKLWARKDVPKPLQPIIGKTSLQKSLGTSDLNKARVIFHDVMRRFEARIAAARAQRENQPIGFQPITFTTEELGMSRETAEAWARFEAMKPENQMRETTQRMERKLVEAGLTALTPETVSVSLDHRLP